MVGSLHNRQKITLANKTPEGNYAHNDLSWASNKKNEYKYNIYSSNEQHLTFGYACLQKYFYNISYFWDENFVLKSCSSHKYI